MVRAFSIDTTLQAAVLRYCFNKQAIIRIHLKLWASNNITNTHIVSYCILWHLLRSFPRWTHIQKCK
jgi:hypothetical protein